MSRKTPFPNQKTKMTHVTHDTYDTLNFFKKIGETFVNRKKIFVTLHQKQSRRAAMARNGNRKK